MEAVCCLVSCEPQNRLSGMLVQAVCPWFPPLIHVSVWPCLLPTCSQALCCACARCPCSCMFPSCPSCYSEAASATNLQPLVLPAGESFQAALYRVLRLPSVGSKRFLTTKVDRHVTGGRLICRITCTAMCTHHVYHAAPSVCASWKCLSILDLDQCASVCACGAGDAQNSC